MAHFWVPKTRSCFYTQLKLLRGSHVSRHTRLQAVLTQHRTVCSQLPRTKLSISPTLFLNYERKTQVNWPFKYLPGGIHVARFHTEGPRLIHRPEECSPRAAQEGPSVGPVLRSVRSSARVRLLSALAPAALSGTLLLVSRVSPVAVKGPCC